MNAENLTPFQPGQSGNPTGRPRKLPGLDRLLAEVLGEDLKEAKAILEALLARAKKGHTKSAQMILDRAFGKEIIPLILQDERLPTIDFTALSEETLKEILHATTLPAPES